MLSDFCSVSENEYDDFVGLRIADGLPSVVFPRGFSLSNDDKQLRRDVLRLLSAIQKFGGNREGEKPEFTSGERQDSFPFISYQYIIQDFMAHGYYTEKEVRYVKALKGKINWKRTIQQQQPQLDGENVVYLDFTVKTNKINDNNLITKIHEYCVYESFRMIGWLFVSTEALPKKPSIPFNRRQFLTTLQAELSTTFNDSKKRLLQNMINVVQCAEEFTSATPKVTFGVNRFEYIWEDMINYVFGEDDRERYFPHAHWHIIRHNGYDVQSSELRPDTIAKVDEKVFILDAKYYKFGVTGNPMHLPATDSVQKQITYGEFVDANHFGEQNSIFNAFIMPFNKGAAQQPYKFVSVATADWKAYNAETPNYYYVLGILLDTRYLMTSYTKHNTSEIMKLCSLIESSLQTYRAMNT